MYYIPRRKSNISGLCIVLLGIHCTIIGLFIEKKFSFSSIQGEWIEMKHFSPSQFFLIWPKCKDVVVVIMGYATSENLRTKLFTNTSYILKTSEMSQCVKEQIDQHKVYITLVLKNMQTFRRLIHVFFRVSVVTLWCLLHNTWNIVR